MPATAGKFGSKDALTPSGRQKISAVKEQKDLLRELTATAEQSRDISGELYETTRGLREGSTDQLTEFLRSGELPPSLRGIPEGISQTGRDLYRTGREDVEAQFRRAGEQIRNEIPAQGGQLNQALINLAQGRAGQVGRLRGDIQRQLFTQVEVPLLSNLFGTATSTGFGTPQVALQGLSSAGQGFGSAAEGFSDIATRSLGEQLEREKRSKEEVQQIAQAVAFAG